MVGLGGSSIGIRSYSGGSLYYCYWQGDRQAGCNESNQSPAPVMGGMSTWTNVRDIAEQYGIRYGSLPSNAEFLQPPVVPIVIEPIPTPTPTAPAEIVSEDWLKGKENSANIYSSDYIFDIKEMNYELVRF